MAHVTPAELDTFLEKYVELGFNFSAACRAIDRSGSTMYTLLERNEAFAQRFHALKRTMADALLAEAYRRAVEGTDKPVYQSGTLVGYIREYSDTLLVKCIAALRPEFKDTQLVEVKHGVDVSDAQLSAKLSAIFEAAKRKRDVIEGEFTEVLALPAPNNEDLL